MKVSDLMQRRVVTSREEQSLKTLAETLFDHGISGMPVIGADGAVVGVVSEADLLHKQGGRPTRARARSPGSDRRRGTPRWMPAPSARRCPHPPSGSGRRAQWRQPRD
jgi:CBS-domain-containing membrane protein